eukprot:COSAG05_NODE_6462_length_953_cov_0.954333_2_plen_99_part_01
MCRTSKQGGAAGELCVSMRYEAGQLSLLHEEERLFEQLDTDKSNDISVEEVLKMLVAQGFGDLGADTLKKIMSEFDRDDVRMIVKRYVWCLFVFNGIMR